MDWQPIETFPSEHPYTVSDYTPGTKYYERALVAGRKWESDANAKIYPDQNPHHPEHGGGFTSEVELAIARTYSDQGFWVLDSSGPSDYDEYILPTHWMPLPPLPDSK